MNYVRLFFVKLLFLVTISVWIIPYIGRYDRCWYDILIVKFWDIFLNVSFHHYRIVIYLFHFCLITVLQENYPETREKYIHKNIAPLPVFIVLNAWHYLGYFGFVWHAFELRRGNCVLDNFYLGELYVYPHKISHHSGVITNKNTNVSVMLFVCFLFENVMRLMIDSRTKYVTCFILVCNCLVCHYCIRKIIEK